MATYNKKEYNKILSERLKMILYLAGLEIKGIAAITNKSIDIYYAILSQRKPLTVELAFTIGEALDFDGKLIFNLNSPIPNSIKYSEKLRKFKFENFSNIEYFVNSWSDEKISNYIKRKLIDTDYFVQPKYAWEVNNKLADLGRKINSDLLSKHLKYLVTKGVLKSKRAPIKLKGGGFGLREVDIYFTS